MPEIKSTRSKVLGPLDYTGYADPNINNSGVPSEKIGSKDTLLSLLGGSYDAYFDPVQSQNQQRYQNQGMLQWLGNNAWTLGKSTAEATVKGIGGTASLLASPFVMASGYNFWDAFEYNPVIHAGTGIRTMLDYLAPSPTFVGDDFNAKSFSETILDGDVGQLVSQNIDSLGFLTSAIATGGLLSRLNAGSKLVSKFAKGNALDDVLEGAAAKDYSSKARKIDHLLSHTVLTTGEAAQEGADLKKQLVEKLTRERIEGKNTLSDEEISNIAADKATNVFWQNLAALSVTNIPFTKLYGKVFSKVEPSGADLALQLGKDGFEATKLKGLQKIFKSKEFLPTASLALLGNIVTESLEESTQHTIQKINESSKRSLSLYDSTLDLLSAKSAVETTLGIFTDEERGKAAGLGGLIGGAGVALRLPSMYKEAKQYKDAQRNAIKELNEKFDTVLSSNVYKKTPDKKVTISTKDNDDGSRSYTREVDGKTETITTEEFNALKENFNLSDNGGEYTVKGTYELDADNNPIVDPLRVAELQASASHHAELDDMMENLQLYGGSSVSRSLVRHEKLSELAALALSNGAFDLLLERFETARDDREALQKYGASEQELTEDIRALNEMKNIYDNVSKDLLATNDSERRLNSIRKKRMFSLGVRASLIRTLSREKVNEVAEKLANLQAVSEEDLTPYLDAAVALRNTKSKIDTLLDTDLTNLDYFNSLTKKASELQDKLNSFKDITSTIRKTDLESIVDSATTLFELNEARKEIDDVYDQYLTTKDLQKVAKMEDTAFKTYSEKTPAAITFTPQTTKELFQAYIDRRISKLEKRNLREFGQKELIARWADNFARSIDVSNDGTVEQILETASSIAEAFKSIQDSEFKISPETYQLLMDKLNEFIGNIPQDMTVEQGEDEVSIFELVAPIFEGIDLTSSVAQEKILTKDELMVEAIDELSSTARSVTNDFNDDPEGYEDLGSVTTEIKKLTEVVRLLKELDYPYQQEEAILDLLNNTVLKQVENNVINKNLKNIEQNKLYGESFKFLLEDQDVREALKDSVDLVKLDELFKVDPYTAALTLAQGVKNIKLDLNKFLAEVKEEGNVLLPSSNDLAVRNPIKFVITYLQRSKYQHPAVERFLEDYNIVEFIKNSKGDPTLERVTALMMKSSSLLDLQYAMNSTLDSIDILSRIKSFVDQNKSGGLPAPSVAQERVITQLAHFMSSPSVGTKPHDDVAALKSPPGAGKTLIIIPTLLKVLGLTSKNIITAASQELAAKNLSSAVGTAKGLSREDLIEMFDSDSVSDEVSMIVFDEASVASTTELYEVAKAFTRYKLRNPNKKVKMIYLYDPNQGTGRVDGASSLEALSFSEPIPQYKDKADKGQDTGVGGEFYYSHHIYDIMPLPVSYRSDVPQILSLQNRFLSKTEVPANFEASSSSDPISSTFEIQGSYVGNSARMLEILNSSKSSNPNRTRAIIVLDEASKAKYLSTGETVLTTKEAAGLAFDEVYVDAPRLMSDDVDKIRSYNQRVYTAISRAKQFSYLAGHEGTNTIDTAIPEKIAINSAFKVSRHAESLEEKDEQIKTIESIVNKIEKKDPVVEAVEAIEDTDVEVKEDEYPTSVEDLTEIKDDISEDNVDNNSLPDVPTNPTIFPNNETLRQIQAEGIDEVIVVEELDGPNSLGFRILVPSRATSSVNATFFDLAIMNKAAAVELSKQLGFNLSDVKAIQKVRKDGDLVKMSNTEGGVANSSLRMKVDPRSHTLKFYYNPKNTETVDPLKLVSRLIEGFETSGQKIVNKQDVLSNISSYASLKYFTSKDQKEKVFGDRAVSVPTGKPLIVVQGLTLASGRTLPPMFIELETPVLDLTSPEAQRYGGKELLTLISELTAFQKLMDSLTLPSPYTNYKSIALGIPMTGSNGSQYYPFHAFIAALSDFHNGQKKDISLADKATIDGFNKLNPNIALPQIELSNLSETDRKKLEALALLASKIDTLVHGDRKNADGTYRRRSYMGKAQTAMDRVSSANYVIELPNMTTKILRSTRTKMGDKGLETYTGGLTLLGPVSFALSPGKVTGRNSKVGMSYNQLFPQSVIEDLRTKSANPNYKWSKAPAIQDLLSKEDPTAMSFTLDDMRNLFEGNGPRNANSGFGLRAPIYKPLFQTDNTPIDEVSFDGVATSNFTTVIPTNLGLVFNNKSSFEKTIPDVEVEKPIVTQAKEEIRTAVQENRQPELTEEELDSLEVPLEEAIKNYNDNTIAEFIKRPNFLALMKTVFTLNSSSLRNKVKGIFDRSPQAIGSKLEKAPRDFIASFAIAHILGKTNPGGYSRDLGVSNIFFLVQRYYSSTKNDSKTTAAFAKALNKAIKEEGLSESVINENAMDLANEVTSIMKSIGVDVTIPNFSENPLAYIKAIVLASSDYRNSNKEEVKYEDASVIPSPKFLDKFLEEGKSPEEIVEELDPVVYKDVINYINKQLSIDEDVTTEELVNNIYSLFPRMFSSKMEFEETDPVSEDEARTIHNKIFNPIGIRYISRIFSSKKGETFRIVEANRLISELGDKVWGMYRDGISYVGSVNSKVGSKVVLHEAFHQVFDKYLTPSERKRLLSMATKRYGNLNTLELEERLADDFMNYKTKAKTFSQKIASIFRKIARFFNFTFHNFDSIEAFFESTLDGNFHPRNQTHGETRNMEIERFFGDYTTYELAKKVVLDRFEEIEQYDRQNKILSFDEILGEVFTSLRRDMEEGALDPIVIKAISPLFHGTQALKQFANYFFGNTPAIKSIQAANAQAKIEWEAELERLENSTVAETISQEDFESEEEYEQTLQEQEFAVEQRKLALKNLLKADVSAETIDHELVDPESKITGIVKQRLLSVKYKNKGQEVRADFSKVYNVVLNLLSSSDNSSMESMIDSIRQRTKSILTVKSRNDVPKNVRVAAALFIEEQLDKYIALKDKAPKSIVFRKDVNHSSEYVIYSNTVDVTKLTYTTAKDMKGVNIVFFDPANYNTFDAFSKSLPIKYNIVKDAFDFYEQSNFIKSMAGAVVSLRRSSPSVGIREYKDGVYSTRYINNREAGAKAVLETDIINGYIKLVAKQVKAGSKTVFSNSLLSSLNTYTDENAFSVANSVLVTFGIKGFRKDHASLDEIKTFLDKAKLVLEKINSIGEDSPFDIISDESSFIDSAVDLISTSGNLIQNSSYIRGDGKRAYLWVDSSLQTSIFTAITNAIKGYSGMKTNYFSISQGGKLSTKSDFLKNNIFFNGVSNIFGTTEHDSIKWRGRDINATDLYNETTVEALVRTFDLGFLSKLASKNSYFQFLPIPSNRRTISAVEVSYLNPDRVRNAIKNIISQQKNRPNPKDSKRLSNNDNYKKNYDKFNLPGLDGKSVNMSNDEAYKLLMEEVSKRSEQLFESIVTNLKKKGKELKVSNYQIDMKSFALAYKKVTGKTFESGDNFAKTLKAVTNAYESGIEHPVFKAIPTKEDIEGLIEKRESYIDNALREVVTEYYLNALVNSYSLSQMLYGDQTFYKSKEDLTKRIQVFTATGDVPITDEVDGFPPVSRVGVMSDIDVVLDELPGLKDDSFRETSNEGDGQGYMLPESYERLALARGKHNEDDVTLKTVYAAVDEEGVPTLLKYAVIVLTDELIGYDAKGNPRNRTLHNLREAMRNPKDGKGPIDQAVFESAVKTGAPSKKNMADPENPFFGENSIVEIDNRHFRFQLNPAAEVDKTVANPSQLTAMVDTNGKNAAEIFQIHMRNSMIMDVGMRLASKTLGISRKGKLTKASEKVLRKRLIKSNQGMTGKEALVTMLGAQRNNNFTVSLDLPIIGNQLISSLASIISSSTVGFRFPGSKLVLQSEYGTYNSKDFKLKYKDENGFTEVMLPENYREFFEEGNIIANDAMMGFRIPSSNYHSGVALKVKGFYRVPAGSAGNIVIAPTAMSYFQGSDSTVRLRSDAYDKTFLIAGTSHQAKLEDNPQPSLF